MQVSSQCLLPHLEHPEPSEWSDRDDMEDAIEIELLSLSNPQSGKRDGKPRQPRPPVSPSPIMPSATGWSLRGPSVLGDIMCRLVSRWRSPCSVKPKRLLGWQVYSRTSWSSDFHSLVQYSTGYGPFTLL